MIRMERSFADWMAKPTFHSFQAVFPSPRGSHNFPGASSCLKVGLSALAENRLTAHARVISNSFRGGRPQGC